MRRLPLQFNARRLGPSRNRILGQKRSFEGSVCATDIAQGAPRTAHAEEAIESVGKRFNLLHICVLGNNLACEAYVKEFDIQKTVHRDILL